MTGPQRLEVVGRIAGGVAHDFNNVLTVITSAAELAADALERSPADEPEIGALLEQISDAARRGTELARHLLDFAAGRAGDAVELDLNAQLLGWRPLLQRMIGTGHRLEVRIDPAVPPVVVDPVSVQQVVTNLVVNARDAMPDGGVIVVATALDDVPDSTAGNRGVALVVADRGVGMDAETVARLAEPFFTTKLTAGTGLGLTIVYDVVRAWGGDVTVDSRPGEGTSVRVTLPLVRTARDAVPHEDDVRRSRRILLVEDAADVRDVLARVLSRLGYGVESAATPGEALDLSGQQRFACVVTDVELPGMSGPALVDRLRERHPGLRALFVSGYVDGAVTGNIGEGTQFLAKPFGQQALADALEGLLGDGEGAAAPGAQSGGPAPGSTSGEDLVTGSGRVGSPPAFQAT